MDALDKPGKHRVFRGGPPRFRWITYCPHHKQTFAFPSWEMAMGMRNCCAANYSSKYPEHPANATITDPPSERARDWMLKTRMEDG